MKTVDERIENLSDELLGNFINGVSTIYCGDLLCEDCPVWTDDDCIFVKLYREEERRMARPTKEV